MRQDLKHILKLFVVVKILLIGHSHILLIWNNNNSGPFALQPHLIDPVILMLFILLNEIIILILCNDNILYLSRIDFNEANM